MLDEPVRGAVPDRSLLSLTGLEQLRAFMRSLVPPLPAGVLLNIRITEASSGSAVLRQLLTPWYDNGQGSMILTPIAEFGMLSAAITGAPPATELRTANVSMRYLRPCTLDSESVVVRARILHAGSVFTTVEALIEDRLGRAVAHGTSSVLIYPIDLEPPVPAAPLRPVEMPVYATPAPPDRPVPRAREPWPGPGWDRVRRGLAPDKDQPLLLPPIATLIGTRILDVAPGRSRIAVPASGWFGGMYGSASPGLVGAVGETAIGLAMASVAEPGQHIRVNHVGQTFLAPVVTRGQELVGEASVRYRGDVLICEAQVSEPDGTVVALGQMTCVLRGDVRRETSPPERVLLTVLFTDLVGSTELAARSGPDRWRTLLEQHHAVVRRQLELHRGREVKCTGDGFLATFDSPTRAVAFARAARDGLDGLDLAVRIGIHAGECEVMGSDVGGLAVHVASRVEAAAGPREILVSSTVHDMLIGSGVSFVDHGHHVLKGIEGEHRLWSVG